ncbi:hypothetical protein SLEP1_g55027 [Rubroshorea leprosula]|uniref:Leucine-rich repeat-containing N-terminal plant-type domain-containing protein n=1 Tax=Rubroshorea leprosula TaxID=152421 RepID=A0AAV5ME68_9ROSI|nr:hypothetical protein SLEP1_g55027 [Rubroshorea leprosula]
MKRALKCEEQRMYFILCFPLFLPTPIMSSGFLPTLNLSLVPEFIHFRSLALQMQNQSDKALALLAFKNISVSADPKGFLADWTPRNPSLCPWHGVICSPPGKVHALTSPMLA